MSIKEYVIDLERVDIELKNLRVKVKMLNAKRAEILKNITAYCQAKNQPGIKFNGKAIVVQEKETTKIRRDKGLSEDELNLLKEEGVKSPEKLYEKLKQVRKGETVVKTGVKITKIK